MKRYLCGLLAFCCFLSSHLLNAQEEASVSVTVQKKELKYIKACTWDIYERSEYGLPSQVTQKIKIDASENLPVGKYLAVVNCPSTEGTLRKTKSFKVENFQTQVNISFNLVPSFLLVEVKKDQQSIGSKIWVYDEWGIRVAAGIDRAVIAVPPGRLWVYARPEEESTEDENKTEIGVKASGQVNIQPLAKTALKLDVTPSHLRVSLKNNGRSAKGVVTLLTKGGKSVLDWDSGQEVEVPPGVYQVKTQLEESHDFLSKVRREIKLAPGKNHNITIQHATGKVRPTVVLKGKKVNKTHPDYDQIEVALHRAGALNGFNSVASGEQAVLTPGTYDLYAQMKEKKLDDGSLWRSKKRIDVDARGEYSYSINLTPAQINLTTLLGEEGSSVHISLLRLDDDVKILESKTDGAGQGLFRIRPGGYRLLANPNPSNPELTQEQLVDLKPGQNLSVRMAIPLGRVMVQVFNEEGVAVWCDVGLFRDGASKPLWTFKGGEEIWVPAGTYEIEVRYKGGRHAFEPPLRVSAGRTAERKLIWP